jgi:hypothetical protein
MEIIAKLAKPVLRQVAMAVRSDAMNETRCGHHGAAFRCACTIRLSCERRSSVVCALTVSTSSSVLASHTATRSSTPDQSDAANGGRRNSTSCMSTHRCCEAEFENDPRLRYVQISLVLWRCREREQARRAYGATQRERKPGRKLYTRTREHLTSVRIKLLPGLRKLAVQHSEPFLGAARPSPRTDRKSPPDPEQSRSPSLGTQRGWTDWF